MNTKSGHYSKLINIYFLFQSLISLANLAIFVLIIQGFAKISFSFHYPQFFYLQEIPHIAIFIPLFGLLSTLNIACGLSYPKSKYLNFFTITLNIVISLFLIFNYNKFLFPVYPYFITTSILIILTNLFTILSISKDKYFRISKPTNKFNTPIIISCLLIFFVSPTLFSIYSFYESNTHDFKYNIYKNKLPNLLFPSSLPPNYSIKTNFFTIKTSDNIDKVLIEITDTNYTDITTLDSRSILIYQSSLPSNFSLDEYTSKFSNEINIPSDQPLNSKFTNHKLFKIDSIYQLFLIYDNNLVQLRSLHVDLGDLLYTANNLN